jgi:serine/threonine protein kinase
MGGGSGGDAVQLLQRQSEQAGSRLGPYRLLTELARGGMGIVHLALLQGTAGVHKLVVVKELRQEFAADQAFARMFLDEARIAALLTHPNVVQTLDVGCEGSRLFIAMEYLEGQSLSRMVRRARQREVGLQLETYLGIVIDALSALEYVHGVVDYDGTPLRIVHRDVCPQNVFLTYQGQTKLIDFGIAKAQTSKEEARTGLLKGRAKYIAPEYVAGCDVDARADVYAVGVMLWEAVAGRHPWEGESESCILGHLVSGAIPSVRGARSDVDPELAAIVDRATRKEPGARYPSAAAMRADLELLARRWGPMHSPLTLGPSAIGGGFGAVLAQLFAGDWQAVAENIHAPLAKALSETPERGSGTPPAQLTMTASVPCAPLPLWSSSAEADGTPSSIDQPLPQTEWSRRMRRAGWPLAGMVALGAVIASVQFMGSQSSGAASAALPSRGIARVAPVREARRSVRVAIYVSPLSAVVYLDDAIVENPYVFDREVDTTAHRLRAESPGYETKTAILAFDADTRVDLELLSGRDPQTSDARPSLASTSPLRGVRGAAGEPRQPVTSTAPGVSRPPDIGADLDKANPYTP